MAKSPNHNITKWPHDPMTQPINPPVKILFVCIGNSCRSQMAEGWANYLGKGRVQASSAGSHPFGSIVKDTYTVMSEKGISLDGHYSKGLRDVAVGDMDVVVGMGSEVEWSVPVGFKGRKVEWDVLDPYALDIETFRNVRDMIERQVLALLADLVVPDASE
jgi:arsenate reductase